jgi:hypothetical protein
MRLASLLVPVALLGSTACVGLEEEEEPCGRTGDARADDGPIAHQMPADVVAFLETNRWGDAHFEFHTTRRWDGLPQSAKERFTEAGLERNPTQEGQVGTGIEFLAMHRHMLRHMRAAFPAHAALLAGWTSVPTDPADVENPVPGGAAFSGQMLTALGRVGDPVQLTARFPDDDAFGLWIQTAVVEANDLNPPRPNADKTAGLHNYLHSRWAERDSPINLQNSLVNLQHEYFWRLHGWLDAQWSAYRAAMGLVDESDATYQAAMAAAQAWMHARTGPLPDDDDDGRHDDLDRRRCPAFPADLVELTL